ncbi:MAG: glutamate--tRNA ligase [Pseudomonadota bacterium]
MTVRVRFAPSPTGKLHVGNIRAALFNRLFATRHEGAFLLRIDDTDQERSTAAYEEGIRRDLTWLGIAWDEEARQSARFERYDAARDALIAAGRLYPCYETAEELDRKRKLQRARGLPPVYDRAALDLTDAEKKAHEADGRKPHWRFKLARKTVAWTDLIRGATEVDTGAISDPVLIREDGMYLYTLPSCVDDLEYKITHVVRGEDHVTNTAAQIELFEALKDQFGGAVPTFAHHSLLVGADGQGLSKRLGSLSIEAMREEGMEAAAITSLLARLGTSDPVVAERSLQALADGFDFAKMGRAPARFDPADVAQLTAKILHETPYEDVRDRIDPSVDERLWLAVRENLDRAADAAAWAGVVYGEIEPAIEDAEFSAKAAALVPDESLDAGSWAAFTSAVKEATGAKGKALFMPLRKALTGRERGPDMAALFPLIGSERARRRLTPCSTSEN